MMAMPVTASFYIPNEAKHVLRFASDLLCDNKEVVMEILKEDGGSLKYVSKRLKNDPEVVLCAIENDFSSIVYTGKEIQKQVEEFLKTFSDTSSTTFKKES